MPPPVGSYDFTLVVGETGTATSLFHNTHKVDNFSVKCQDGSSWEFDMDDKDGYPVATSDGGIGVLMGKQSIPINRRCAGFFLTLKRATPDTYYIRASVD